MAAQRRGILDLYKTLLRESEKFSAYNFRMYAIRRIRDAFKDNKNLASSVEIDSAVAEAKSAVQVIKKQALISSLYQADKLVIESESKAVQ